MDLGAPRARIMLINWGLWAPEGAAVSCGAQSSEDMLTTLSEILRFCLGRQAAPLLMLMMRTVGAH